MRKSSAEPRTSTFENLSTTAPASYDIHVVTASKLVQRSVLMACCQRLMISTAHRRTLDFQDPGSGEAGAGGHPCQPLAGYRPLKRALFQCLHGNSAAHNTMQLAQQA